MLKGWLAWADCTGFLQSCELQPDVVDSTASGFVLILRILESFMYKCFGKEELIQRIVEM